jgi:hypothetical protein
MSHTLHSLAGATPKTRAEIRALRAAGVSQRELMKHYSVSKATIIKWASAAELEQTLNDFSLAYNYFIPQQAIGHRAPIDALASWYAQHPEFFIALVMIKDYNHVELNIEFNPPDDAILFPC